MPAWIPVKDASIWRKPAKADLRAPAFCLTWLTVCRLTAYTGQTTAEIVADTVTEYLTHHSPLEAGGKEVRG